MKTETKTFAEYKAPGCKVVEVHMGSALLQDSSYGDYGKAGSSTGVDYDGDDY